MRVVPLRHQFSHILRLGILFMKETQLLQEKAYDYLIHLIKNGELKPDVIYSLNKMSKNANFSKTPFRDAVLRLEQERYLDILPSKGFVLHKMTREDITETYQIRSAIELYCLKQLSLQLDTARGQKYFQKLLSKVKKQKEIAMSGGNTEDFARKDYEFHRSMVQFVGNHSMLEMYRRFMYRIFWLNVTSFSRMGRLREAMEEHEYFLELLKKHDLSELEIKLDQHLSIAQNINLTLLEQYES